MINVSKRIFLLAIILSFTFLSYLPSLKAGFTNWDDDAHVVSNPYIRHLDYDHVEQIINSRIARTYIPLSLFSYALEYHFFKLNPFVYHLNNVLLHLVVTVLVFFLARRFGLNESASAWASLIFGIHPMHVESVAWVSERKDVLCAVFYLLALLGYWKYLDQGRGKWLWYTGTVILGFLSMMSKPMAYSLPLVLVMIDWWHRRKINVMMILDKIPHLGYVFILSWLTLSINKTNSAYSLLQVLLIWIWSFVFYPLKFIIPNYYIAIYKLPQPISLLNPLYVWAILIFSVFLYSIFYFYRQRIYRLAWLFYALTISMIVIRSVWDFGNITIIADRFMYLPSLGFCIWLGFSFDGFQRNLTRNKQVYLNVFLCSLVFLLFVKTFQQCVVWKDNISLWTNVIKYDPHISRAYVNRAQGFIENKEYDLALKDLDAAMIADDEGPKSDRLYVARGLIYFIQNKIEVALNNFNEALKINPYQTDALLNRGNIWGLKKEYDKALKDFYAVLMIQRESPKAYLGLALIYQDLGQLDNALSLYREAIQLDPHDLVIQSNYKSLIDKMNLEHIEK